MHALILLLDTIFYFLIGSAILRAWLVAVGLGLGPQPGRFVVALTDWLVQPLRRVLPKGALLGRWDGASLLAAILLAIAYGGLWTMVTSGAAPYSNSGDFLALVPTQAFKILMRTVFQGLFFLVLGYAILSWIQPQSSSYYVLDRLLAPLLAPIRRVIPVLGGIDLAPIALILALQILQSLVV